MGISHHDRLIVYIANLYFNNYIYSPGSCSDGFYHQFKKRVVYDLLGKVKDPCLLKLYPTHRYLDPDPFADLMASRSLLELYQQLFTPPSTTAVAPETYSCHRRCPPVVGSFNDPDSVACHFHSLTDAEDFQ